MSTTPEFNLDATTGPGGSRIEVTGELDAYSAPQLRRLVDELVGSNAARMVIDLSQTSFIDSTGLGVLVGSARRVADHGGELWLDAPTPAVYRVLQMTGLSLTIPVENPPPTDEGHEIPRREE